VRQLVITVLNIIDARCNHEVYYVLQLVRNYMWLPEVAQPHASLSMTQLTRTLAYFRGLAFPTNSTSSLPGDFFRHPVSYTVDTGGKFVPAANHHLHLTPDVKKCSKYSSTPLYGILDMVLY